MRLFVLLAALAIAQPAAAQQLTSEQVVENVIYDVIRPGFERFNENAAAFEADMQRLCDTPTKQLRVVARAQFGYVVHAWSQIELLRIGPLLDANRSERILFWPDRKGIALRQVQGVLAEADESGLAIGTLVAGVAAEMLDEWLDPDGITRRLTAPSAADPEFRSSREVVEKLVGLLAHGLEAIRDQRLLPFVGRDGAAPKPKSALFWRSMQTVPSIAANFAGLRALFDDSGLPAATAEDGGWIGNSADFEFANVERAVAVVDTPVESAVEDPAQKRALDYLVILTGSLQTLLGDNLSAALGLSVGVHKAADPFPRAGQGI